MLVVCNLLIVANSLVCEKENCGQLVGGYMESLFKPALCTQCGAKLLVDESKEAAICEYCGTPFIVEKAIHNYNISSFGTINIANAVINQGPSAINYVKRAQQFEKEFNINKAKEYYNKALDVDADCIEAINGLTKLKEDIATKESDKLVQDIKIGRAIFYLKKECSRGLNTPRIKGEIQRLESLIKTTVYYSGEAYFRLKKTQLIATKGRLTMNGEKLFFEASSKLLEINVSDILGFMAVENVNYQGETLGRTAPNCVAVRYMDKVKNDIKRVDIRVHDATRVASLLNDVLSDIKFQVC